MKPILTSLLVVLAGWVNAEPSRSPMEWHPVATNEIARWKSANHAPDGLVVDEAAKSVRFLVEATGIDADDPIEFFVIGPLSDRAYEALFVSVASPAALANAFDRIGVPHGRGTDARLAQFWPQGEKLRFTVSPLASQQAAANGKATKEPTAVASTNGIDTVLKDVRVKEEGMLLDKPVAYTAGTRDASGALLAETNMPCAIFALYNHGPSIFQFDGLFEQSVAYGRFVASQKLRTGALYEITATWDGVRRVKEFELKLDATNAVAQIGVLRQAAEQKLDVFARLAFAPEVTVEAATRFAGAFATLDGNGVKMNGAAAGQFFFRAFLPDPKWREPAQRPFQPFEVHIAADGAKTFVHIEEDWSGDGLDPVLKPKKVPFGDWTELPGLIAKSGTEAAKISVLLLYAPKTMRVAELTPVLGATRPRIDTFYIFGE